ncbi:MAG: RsmD family RNA methyltransferase [Acidilobaceae archaeon]|nr:RsmD family RNA methyltransferase [Acidilobaceae archaeon]MCX8165542.1 RsmD family RNA methyltransferase [Acidilobaceae archaeon]MDW7973969.1 RsmD family RNA methyltransferase [Sulfolobales archaeon]
MRAICVAREDAERAIRLLRSHNLLSPTHRPLQLGNKVCLPALSSDAVSILDKNEIKAEETEATFVEVPPKKSMKEMFPSVPSPTFVGDIALFNWKRELPEELYVEAAKALLEEMPRVKAVLLKVETWGELRYQKVRHLAGEQRTRTVHKEYGLSFVVDLAKAYFNPRLAGEHRRVAEEVERGERVLDMFAGVGGHSVHIAALREVKVLASDLNVEAVKLLAENVRLNRRKLRGEVTVLRADASLLPLYLKPFFNRIIMDHPTASRYFAREACQLLGGKGRIVYYTLNISCREASEEALRVFSCAKEVESCREVIDYSPSHSIFCLALAAEGLQV